MVSSQEGVQFSAVSVTGVCILGTCKDSVWTHCEGHLCHLQNTNSHRSVCPGWDPWAQSRGLSDLLGVGPLLPVCDGCER